MVRIRLQIWGYMNSNQSTDRKALFLAAFPASVVAERKTLAAFIPNATVGQLYNTSPSYRDFILAQYSKRMADVIELVEEVAFRKVDERLRHWLLELLSAYPSGFVTMTHQELADHTGTSREVISRILKDWEDRKLVELARGALRVLPGLRTLKM